MKKTISSFALATLLTAGAASAAPGPGPGAPHGPPGVPSAEAIAMIDGLSASQQADVRKILRERRDAEDTLRTRLRGEREALDQRERSERDRIEDQSTQRLRSALGEDGYRAWARWVEMRGPRPMPPQGAHGMDPKPGAPPDAAPPTDPRH